MKCKSVKITVFLFVIDACLFGKYTNFNNKKLFTLPTWENQLYDSNVEYSLVTRGAFFKIRQTWGTPTELYLFNTLLKDTGVKNYKFCTVKKVQKSG